jgi:hypothetical protein
VFEVNPTAAASAGVSERAAWNLLADQGYRFFRWAPSGLVLLAEFPGVHQGSVRNIVAVHQAQASEQEQPVGAGASRRRP